MKQKKFFYCAVLPALTISLLTGCSQNPKESIPIIIDDDEDAPLEIGDTV